MNIFKLIRIELYLLYCALNYDLNPQDIADLRVIMKIPKEE